MAMQHTPGPWAPFALDSEDGRLWTVSSARAQWSKPCVVVDDEADAHLIAAAPEMLEALIDLVRPYRHVSPENIGPCLHKRLVRAEAAIAKATGEAK